MSIFIRIAVGEVAGVEVFSRLGVKYMMANTPEFTHEEKYMILVT